MSNLAIREDRRQWAIAAAVALAAHLGVAGLVLAWNKPHQPRLPEPVVLVELPPLAAPEAQPEPQPDRSEPQPQPQVQQLWRQTVTPPIDLPPVRAPLPQNPVTLPPPSPPQPAAQAAPPAQAAAVSAPASAPADPRAKKAELDYFSLISTHLNRRKSYPAEAKKAHEEGVVVIRFTVDRAGAVSNVGIKRSSGHDLLDTATLQLLQRVAPLPRMPATMQRDSVTIALPIDYSLKTD